MNPRCSFCKGAVEMMTGNHAEVEGIWALDMCGLCMVKVIAMLCENDAMYHHVLAATETPTD